MVSNIGGYSEETNQIDVNRTGVNKQQEDVLVSCSTFGLPGKPSHESSIPLNEAELLYDKLQELQLEIVREPSSDKVHQLQKEIITIAKEHNLLPKGVSADEILSRLTPINNANPPQIPLPRAPGRASEMFCNYVSTGTGSSLPIIILPRLIPILLTPIPRLFVRWSTYEGITSCGGLRSKTGFIAYGAQNGIALGFWGIGFSIFLPPIMAYGLLGYALYASVNAEDIEYWPPNLPPEITMITPPDGAKNVPVSTSELSFHISDVNNALMNYTVTTSPDVGSGSGSNKPDGTYTVPISGLEGSEEYTWHIHVDDGVNEVDVSSTFTTEPVAPIVSNPKPGDGKRYVSLDLSQLSFHIRDPQGDLMDYTVETNPDIGSGSGTGVNEGTYTVDVGGLDNLLDYIWYVNVTDGINWKHKVFSFQTEPMMIFDPFDEGWLYRKKITINHIQVAGNLSNFPVLVSTVDSDLRDKAQDDGDDILFMDDDGVANRLYHEIEYYDGSSGKLIAWVNTTSISNTDDTNFYMYYGNLNSNSQQFPDKVWDSDYIMVQHMYGSNETIYDSTIFDNDGIIYGATRTTGAIGQALHFDGNSYVEFSPVVHLDDDFSVEYWMKLEDYTSYPRVIGYDGQEYITEIWSPDYRIMMANSRIGDDCGASGNSNNWDDGNWYYIVVNRDGVNVNFYYNAVDETYDGTICPGLYERIRRIAGHGMSDDWFIGKIDEIRISNNARSQDWIETSFNTMIDPLSFLSFEPEETGP
jgi:hypothetical protein